MLDYNLRSKQELEAFNNNTNIHELPSIFHYWSNKYLKPIIEQYGMSHPDDLYINHIIESISATNVESPVFVSIGSGNCDTEIRIAKSLLDKGISGFEFECIDLNQQMLDRGRDLAIAEGVIDNISFTLADLNNWKSDKEYTCVIANQSLHHIQNLEGLFSEIKKSLHENGSFISSDMIGRNGHQRWPEALEAVHEFWKELPDSYKYNHLLNRHEAMYENWDCSSEGFEGIRAQDILPLLIKNFEFELFIAFSNIIDIFIDRCFGHNFDTDKISDTDFIDRVHHFDEKSIHEGNIKPTHMMAVMKKSRVINHKYSRGLSPEHCVRDPRQ